MIWAFVIISVVLTGLYLLGPFLTKTEVAAPQALDEARQQRAGISMGCPHGLGKGGIVPALPRRVAQDGLIRQQAK